MSAHQAPETRGVRFAPSPTGRFHLGNLRTAWISYLWSKTLCVPWVVRFEDIDQPRVVPGAQEQQLEDLRALGLLPDITLVQSNFHERHRALFEMAVQTGDVYACDCSRKDVQLALRSISSAPNDAGLPTYSGHCRNLSRRELQAPETIAWRFRMPEQTGRSDFIVARSRPGADSGSPPDAASWVPAYHWACAIDDFDGDYNLLVRSCDLKAAAPLQRAIQEWLSKILGMRLRQPALFHTSLVVQDDGQRLEKRTQGVTLSDLRSLGFSEDKILRLLEQSFNKSLLVDALHSGEMLQENQERVNITALGFR